MACLLLVAIGIITTDEVAESDEATKAAKYPYLSKRLFIENQNDIILNLAPLRTDIREYLDKTGLDYSFYLEYLPSGTSIRAGESEEFVGASLMKLPVVMDLYKASEEGKLSLDDMVIINDHALSQKFGSLYQAGSGSSITLRNAAKLALEESDNTAARVILEQTQRSLNPRERSLNFLDAEITESKDGEQPVILISARAYSSFLKCLYLSCYLNYDNPQAVLQTLTETDFHSRLEAGVADKSVKVAHKIGTYSQQSSSDCGIVYAPKRPYLFCLILNSTMVDVDEIIADVSQMSYEYVTKINASRN